MLKKMVGLFREEEGANMVEYGLIAALIAVAIITVVSLLGEQLGEMFEDITGAIEDGQEGVGDVGEED